MLREGGGWQKGKEKNDVRKGGGRVAEKREESARRSVITETDIRTICGNLSPLPAHPLPVWNPRDYLQRAVDFNQGFSRGPRNNETKCNVTLQIHTEKEQSLCE